MLTRAFIYSSGRQEIREISADAPIIEVAEYGLAGDGPFHHRTFDRFELRYPTGRHMAYVYVEAWSTRAGGK